MVIFQTKNSFSHCFLVILLKNNVEPQPKAFLTIIAQNLVAGLTWIKAFTILEFFLRNGRTKLVLVDQGFTSCSPPSLMNMFWCLSRLFLQLPPKGPWETVFDGVCDQEKELGYPTFLFSSFSLAPEEVQLVRHRWNLRWWLWEQWTRGDFSEELHWQLNSGERGSINPGYVKVIWSLASQSVVHVLAASTLLPGFLEMWNLPRLAEPESAL